MASVTQLVHSAAGSGPGSSHPSASSAPVLEYLCLFTRDLRRKQKRWQDGRIKYHAFNKKIMVYDERGNFVGENHWCEDYDFGDGEEVQLERGGVIVQAGECVGSRDQDLSELVDKRVQAKVERQAAAIARHSQLRPVVQTPAASRGTLLHFQPRHAPLQSLLGTPTGRYGRAQLPTESPFEQRRRSSPPRREDQQENSPRPAKRRKRDASPPSKSGYAQSLFGATLTLSGRPMSTAPIQCKPKKPLQAQHGFDGSLHSSNPRTIDSNSDDDVHEVDPPRVPAPRFQRSQAVKNVTRDDVVRNADCSARSYTRPIPSKRKPRLNPLHSLPPLEDQSIGGSRVSQESRRSRDDLSGHEVPFLNARSRANKCTFKNSTLLSAPTGSAVVDTTGVESRVQHRSARQEIAARSALETSPPLTGIESSSLIANGTTSSIVNRPPLEAKLSTSTNMRKQTNPDSAIAKQAPQKSIDTNGPMIELRVKQSKKRGLLMLSGEGTVKRSRKSLETNGHTSKEAKDSSESVRTRRTDGGHLAGDSCSADVPGAAVSTPGPGTGHESSFHNDKEIVAPTSVKDRSVRSEAKAAVGIEEPENSLFDGGRGLKGSKTKRNLRQTKPSTRVLLSSEALAINAHPREDHPQMDLAGVDPPFGRGSYRQHAESDDPFEEMELRPTAQKRTQHRAEPSKASGRSDPQIFQRIESSQAHETTEEEATIESTTKRQENLKRSFSDEGSLLSVAEGLPHPRLAHLSRKSIKSKEVLGLFFDDDDDSPSPQKRSRSGQAKPGTVHEKDTGVKGGTETESLTSESEDATPPQHRKFLNDRHRTSVPARGPTTNRPQEPQESQRPQVAQTEQTKAGPHKCSSAHEDMQQELADPLQTLVGQGDGQSPARPSGRTHSNYSGMPVVSVARSDSSARPRAVNLERPHGNLAAQPSVPGQNVETPTMRLQPIAKMVNPATRGRKAAKPSDAAGQVPQSVLPSDGSFDRRSCGGVASKESARRATDAVVLPGFSRANGGPWSREAYDLFEFTRPA